VGTFTELGTKRVRETRGIAVSADRSLVATASTHYVCLFDVRRMRQLWCREFATGRVGEEVHGVAMTRDGAAVAAITGSDRNHRHLVVWRGPRWSQRRDVPLPVIPLAVAMCPRGTWVAVAGSDRRVRVFGPDLEPVTSLRGHSDWPRALAVSPDGSRLASADRKGGIRLWDTSDWSAVRTIAGPADCLAFDSTGGRLVASVRQAAGRRRGSPSQPSSSVAVYDATTGKRRSEFRMHRYRFTAAALSPSGRTIACGIEAVADILDQQAVLIDARSGRVVDRLVADFGGHDAFAVLPKRGAVAVGAEGHGRRPLVLWKVSKRAA
jgi:WD40 repeat protein